MKLRMLVLLVCGALTVSDVRAMEDRNQGDARRGIFSSTEARQFILNSFDTPNKKLQLATSIARFPLAITANFLKTKHRKIGYLVSAVTNGVRLVDNSLSIVNNGCNKYNIFLTGYDLVRCGKDIATALSSDALEYSPPVSAMNSIITSARKLLLPLIEANYSLRAAIPLLQEEYRNAYQSLSTFAQLLSDYLDSPSKGVESKFLLACLLVNGASAIYDFANVLGYEIEQDKRETFLDEEREQQRQPQIQPQDQIPQEEHQVQPQNQVQLQDEVIHQQEDGDLSAEILNLIAYEQRIAEEERVRNVQQQAYRPIMNTVLSGIAPLLQNGTIQENLQCPVCIDNFVDQNLPTNQENVLVTNCNNGADHHVYHIQCLTEWAANQRTSNHHVSCPQCNSVLEPR